MQIENQREDAPLFCTAACTAACLATIDPLVMELTLTVTYDLS